MIKQHSFYFIFPVLLLLGLLVIPSVGNAQSFEQGLDFYQQKEYKKATTVFSDITSPQGHLFAGKSFYALGQYDVAQSNLNNVPDDAPPQIYYEAMYTSALIDFQRKIFGDALKKLFEVTNTQIDSDLILRANKLYGEILNYLTADQRLTAFENIESDEIKFALLESGFGKMEFDKAKELYDRFLDHSDNDKWNEKTEELDSYFTNASAYRSEYGAPAQKLQPPKGTTYTIGMALPEYQPDAREFEIVRAMYFGAMIAADNFNDNSRNAKAYIKFSDTGTSTDGLQSKMEQFSDDYYGDIVIGPLFSEQAEPMVNIATDLQLPIIAPLANSDINAENSFLFQANPTFKIHGKQMAQYAVNELGHKDFAVIAARNTNGAISAQAFQEEIKRLGANMHHFFIEDLESNEYEISRYTKYFGSTESIDAVYAPFTGARALNLIDLLFVNLRGMGISPVILGSQEYKNMNFEANKYRNLDILFSESTYQSNRGANVYRFKNKYERNFGDSGNQYAMLGYDVARFILETLQKVGNPALLPEAISKHPKYRGLVKDIYFDGGNINHALKILEVTGTGDVRVRN